MRTKHDTIDMKMLNTNPTRVTDQHVRRIAKALEAYRRAHPTSRINVQRQNSVSIRVRIIDPAFKGTDRIDRDVDIWKLLETLPASIQSQITVVLLLTPEEARESLANFEFEHPIPSRL